MKAVVLAAGFATRLYPLTRDHAKPLLDVAGRAVLSHILDRVQEIGALTGVLIVTNARFHAQFARWRDEYPSRVPIQLINDGATEDDNRLGALRDLALAGAALTNEGTDEALLVLAGDNLIEFGLTQLVDAFAAHGDPLLMCRRIPGGVPPGRHGEVTVDRDWVVRRFREKPNDPQSDLAATCLYLWPAEVIDELHAYLSGGGEGDAPGHFLAWLAQRRTLRALEVPGRMFDIGNLESLERARAEFRA